MLKEIRIKYTRKSFKHKSNLIVLKVKLRRNMEKLENHLYHSKI